MKKTFASDNNSGVHPSVFEKMLSVNQDHATSYGYDDATLQFEKIIKLQFGETAHGYLVGNGTSANILSLAALLLPGDSVIASEHSHLANDEGGAPEHFLGAKIHLLPAPIGKIKVCDIEKVLSLHTDEHRPRPRVVTITQSTEIGSVYTSHETLEISKCCKQNGLLLHVDGARIANAACTLNATFKELTLDCGVDVLSLGGTKNGLMGADAIIFMSEKLGTRFRYTRKLGMQLFSKHRFLAAQFVAYFESELWKTSAGHSNSMAKRLADKLNGKIEVLYPVESNAVFARLDSSVISELQKEFYFYVWDPSINSVRWMMSFDTTEQEVYYFAKRIKEQLP